MLAKFLTVYPSFHNHYTTALIYSMLILQSYCLCSFLQSHAMQMNPKAQHKSKSYKKHLLQDLYTRRVTMFLQRDFDIAKFTRLLLVPELSHAYYLPLLIIISELIHWGNVWDFTSHQPIHDFHVNCCKHHFLLTTFPVSHKSDDIFKGCNEYGAWYIQIPWVHEGILPT